MLEIANIRQNPVLANILSAVVGLPLEHDPPSSQPLPKEYSSVPIISEQLKKSNDIMVSHDRFAIYRATVLNTKDIDGSQFSTGYELILKYNLSLQYYVKFYK